jgi:hypothetical protein
MGHGKLNSFDISGCVVISCFGDSRIISLPDELVPVDSPPLVDG